MANAWDSDPVANAAPAEKPAWAADPVVVRGGRRGGDAGHVRPMSADEEMLVPGGETRGAADTALAAASHGASGIAKLVTDTPQALWDLYAHSRIGPNPGGAPHPNPAAEWIDKHTYDPHTAIGKENFDTAADLAKKGSENIGPMLRTTLPGAVVDAGMNAPELAPVRRVGADLSAALPLAGRAVGAVGGAIDDIAASRSGAASGKYGLAGDANSSANIAKEAGYDIPAAQNPNATMGAHIGDTVAGQANRRMDATARNQVTTNVHAHIGAGLPDNVRMTDESLTAAQTPHNETLNRVADIAQDAPASTDLKKALSGAGGTDILAEDDPRIQKIVDKINSHETLSGQDLLDVSRSTKARGRRYQKSPMPDQQELGDSLIRISNAVDDELARRLPPGSPLQPEDVKAARTSLAQIHTVQDAMVGDNVDANYLARLDARNPGLLTGRLKIIAEAAANHPQVMGLAQRSAIGGEGLSSHHGAALLTAATGAVVHNPALAAVAVGSVGARAALRRIMSGGRTAGVAAAEGASTNPALGKFFEQKVTPRAANVLELQPPEGRAFSEHQPSVLRSGENVPVAERGGLPPNLTLEHAPGNAFEPHQPGVLRPGERVPLAESTQNPRTSLTLEPPLGNAFEAHQPGVLRPGERVPLAESTQNPRTSVALEPPPGTALDNHQPELPMEHPPVAPNPSQRLGDLMGHGGGSAPPNASPVVKPAAGKAAPLSLADELTLAPDELPRGVPKGGTELGKTASGATIRKVGPGVEINDRAIAPDSTVIATGPANKPTSFIAMTPQEDGSVRLTSAFSDRSSRGAGQRQIHEAAQHAESLGHDLTSDTSVSKSQLHAYYAARDKGLITFKDNFPEETGKLMSAKGEKGTVKKNTPVITDIKPVIEN